MTKRRARELGLPYPGVTGTFNSITDVPGVEVGYTTLIDGEGHVEIGKGPVRTGVTAILPVGKKGRLEPIWSGYYSLNGNGEMTGMHWVKDAGYFISPICITSTHAVGITHHATTQWMIKHYKEQLSSEHIWLMPVVAETYDGILNDINGSHIQEEHVFSAIESAKSGPIAEGNVGGGTGMVSYGFKAGSGTASRVLEIGGEKRHIGVFVQTNHGHPDLFTVLGVPVGKHFKEKNTLIPDERGSIIVIIGTDIPMLPHQLTRVAKRAAIGIGRNGTSGGNGSGDIFLAFSNANRMELHQFMPEKLQMDFINDQSFDPIYEAACQATEEAIVNAMLAAETMSIVKPLGSYHDKIHAIDHEELIEIMRKYNRI